jgi:Zn-dependent protease
MHEVDLVRFFAWYIVFLFSLVAHEAAHALAALRGGDDTAYRGGQVSLNPWPHMRREPFGTILIPVLSFFMAGWTMGWASTPYNPEWARRWPRRAAVMSAAGPAANLALVAAAFLAIKLLLAIGIIEGAGMEIAYDRLVEVAPAWEDSFFAQPLATVLSIVLSLNFLLLLFNLIPLPPFDGSGILGGLFPKSLGHLYGLVAHDQMFSILGLILAWRIFPKIAGPAFRTMLELLGA